MIESNSSEIIYGFTAEKALDKLSENVKSARRSNARFTLLKIRRYLTGNFNPIAKIDGPLCHRDVLGKVARIVRTLKKKPELLSDQNPSSKAVRQKMAERCERLADTMQCIEMDSSWESDVLSRFSDLLRK